LNQTKRCKYDNQSALLSSATKLSRELYTLLGQTKTKPVSDHDTDESEDEKYIPIRLLDTVTPFVNNTRRSLNIPLGQQQKILRVANVQSNVERVANTINDCSLENDKTHKWFGTNEGQEYILTTLAAMWIDLQWPYCVNILLKHRDPVQAMLLVEFIFEVWVENLIIGTHDNGWWPDSADLLHIRQHEEIPHFDEEAMAIYVKDRNDYLVRYDRDNWDQDRQAALDGPAPIMTDTLEWDWNDTVTTRS